MKAGSGGGGALGIADKADATSEARGRSPSRVSLQSSSSSDDSDEQSDGSTRIKRYHSVFSGKSVRRMSQRMDSKMPHRRRSITAPMQPMDANRMPSGGLAVSTSELSEVQMHVRTQALSSSAVRRNPLCAEDSFLGAKEAERSSVILPFESYLFRQLNQQPELRNEAMSFLADVLSEKKEFAPWRQKLFAAISRSKALDNAILLLILMNCIFLALFDPTQPDSTRNQVSYWAEVFFTTAFTLEMTVRITAQGFFMPRIAYLRDSWNCLDFVIVVSGLAAVITDIATASRGGTAVSALRAFRLFKPLRAVTKVKEVQVIVNSLLQSLPQLLDVFILYVFFLLIMGIVAVQLWKGKLRYTCEPDLSMLSPLVTQAEVRRFLSHSSSGSVCSPDKNVLSVEFDGYICPWGYNCMKTRNPYYGKVSFDHIGASFLTLFTVVTMEGWSDVMYLTVRTASMLSSLVFLVAIAFGSFFIVNLSLVIINNAFVSNVEQQRERELSIERVANTAAEEHRLSVLAITEPKPSALQRVRNAALTVVTNKHFTRFMTGVVLVNCALLGVQSAGQPQGMTDFTRGSAYGFAALYIVECAMKLAAYPVAEFVTSFYNVLEFVIVVSSIVDLAYRGGEGFLNSLRLARIFQSARYFPSLWLFFQAITASVKGVAVLTLLLIIVIFIYALLGMQLFGNNYCGLLDGKGSLEYVDAVGARCKGRPRAHFDDLFWALVSVFQVISGEDWNISLFHAMHATHDISCLYFVSLFMIGNYIVLNLFIAVLLGGLESSKDIENEPEALPPPDPRLIARASILLKEPTEGEATQGGAGLDDMLQETERAITSLCSGNRKIAGTSGDGPETPLKGKGGGAENRITRSNSADIIIRASGTDKVVGNLVKRYGSMEVPAANGGESAFLREASSEVPHYTPNAYSVKMLMKKHIETQRHKKPDFAAQVREVQEMLTKAEGSELSVQLSGSNRPSREPSKVEHSGITSPTTPQNTCLDSGHSTPRLASPRTVPVTLRDADASPVHHAKTLIEPFGRVHSGEGEAERQAHPLATSSISSSQQHLLPRITTGGFSEAAKASSSSSSSSAAARDTPRSPPTNPLSLRPNSRPTSRPNSADGGADEKKLFSIRQALLQAGVVQTEELLSQENTEVKSVGEEAAEEEEDATLRPSTSSASLDKSWSLEIPQNVSPLDKRKLKSMTLSKAIKGSVFARRVGDDNESSIASVPDTLSSSEDSFGKVPTLSGGSPVSASPHGVRKRARQARVLSPWMRWIEDFMVRVSENPDAMYVLSPTNPVRVAAKKVVELIYFEIVVVAFILMSTVCLALENPRSAPDEPRQRMLELLGVILTGIFTFEALLRIVAYGFLLHKDSYLRRDAWNVLDFIIVVASLCDVILSQTIGSDSDGVKVLEQMRLFRTLRPLRFINKSRGLKRVVDALVNSIKGLTHVVVITAMIFIIFGIMGMQLFMGRFDSCTYESWGDVSRGQACPHELLDPIRFATNVSAGDAADPMYTAPCTLPYIRTQEECEHWGARGRGKDGQPLYYWDTFGSNFDNLFFALVALFEMATLEGWVEVMRIGVDSNGSGAPLENHNPVVAIYFLLVIVILAFFLTNLFVGVLLAEYEQAGESDEYSGLTDPQTEYKLMLDIILSNTKPIMRERAALGKNRAHLHNLVTSRAFETAISGCIALNVVTMSLEWAGQSQQQEDTLFYLSLSFISIFAIEAALKLTALGVIGYYNDSWNRFDFAVVMISVIGVVLKFSVSFSPFVISVLRVLRLARLLRVARMTKGVRMLLRTLFLSVPSLVNVGALLALLFSLYAIIGMKFFGRVTWGQFITTYANFDNFINAVLLLFRISTGEGWHGIMRECKAQEPYCSDAIGSCGNAPFAYVYFLSFIILSMFILLNLIVAIILKEFTTATEEDAGLLTADDIIAYSHEWEKLDPARTGFLPAEALKVFIESLGPPLGSTGGVLGMAQPGTSSFKLAIDLAKHLNNYNGMIRYDEVLFAAAKSVVAHEYGVAIDSVSLPMNIHVLMNAKFEHIFPHAARV